jgi:NCAIR mutase (PurE)-related protein
MAAMDHDKMYELLTALQTGKLSVDEAMGRLRHLPFEPMAYANVDHHRALRCGQAEVIFCPGKSVQQVLGIAQRLAATGQVVLATRASDDQLSAMATQFPQALLNHQARAAIINDPGPCDTGSGERPVGVVCAGTADLPVAEEALFTLRAMRVPATRMVDVGVAGLHRLLSHVETLQSSCALVVCAGMEGALPSVVGGLVSCPVFAVPTSIGYGASLGGIAALLGMLNSCASNVSVVNIDNGFGAAYCAGMVFKQVAATSTPAPAAAQGAQA